MVRTIVLTFVLLVSGFQLWGQAVGKCVPFAALSMDGDTLVSCIEFRSDELSKINVSKKLRKLNPQRYPNLKKIILLGKFPSYGQFFDVFRDLAEVEIGYNEAIDWALLEKELLSLEALQRMMIYKCGIDNAALESFSFPLGLKELNLRDNQLTHIPSSLAELKELKKLSLAYNQLSQIDGIVDLTKLQYLDLSNNQINTLFSCPSDPGNTSPTLEVLHLLGNDLKEFPDLTGFPHLSDVSLEGKSIEFIPGSLLELKRLDIVQVWTDEKVYFSNRLKQIQRPVKIFIYSDNNTVTEIEKKAAVQGFDNLQILY